MDFFLKLCIKNQATQLNDWFFSDMTWKKTQERNKL